MRAHNFIDIQGKKFNRLFVVSLVKKENTKISYWECLCDCGKSIIVQSCHIRGGHTKSCGCLQKETVSEINKSHGISDSEIYSVWQNMKNRCNNENYHRFDRYGGRGIKVCKRWEESFLEFHTDMGERPEGFTIERMDNDGDYEPGNCKWADNKEQCRNRSSNRIITFNGKTMCVADWAEEKRMNLSTIHSRIRMGWSIERTLTEPVACR